MIFGKDTGHLRRPRQGPLSARTGHSAFTQVRHDCRRRTAKSMSGPHDLRRSVAPLSRSAVQKATGGELRGCITRTFRPFR
jgi:hypothetical protein